MPSARTTLLAAVLCLAVVIAPSHAANTTTLSQSPVSQWLAKRVGFRETLIAQGHDSLCDWARFSLLTFMSYTAAANEGERRHWTQGQINACRHALWQYQLCRAFDAKTATALGDQQERDSTDEHDTEADRHNNRIARELYQAHQAQGVLLGEALHKMVDLITEHELFDTGNLHHASE